MRKRVLLANVLKWLKQAIEAAQQDLGDTEGTISALSYRELRVYVHVDREGTHVHIITRNSGFAGNGERTHHATTHDGVEVEWEAQDLGIPTGADWLPVEFVEWMRKG